MQKPSSGSSYRIFRSGTSSPRCLATNASSLRTSCTRAHTFLRPSIPGSSARMRRHAAENSSRVYPIERPPAFEMAKAIAAVRPEQVPPRRGPAAARCGGAPPRPAAAPAARAQRIGRAVLAAALTVAGIWVLHAFLAALVWAGIFAIALWPLYRRLVAATAGRGARVALPFALTAVIGLVFVVPVAFTALELARAAHVAIGLVNEARHTGIAVPTWI